MAKQKIENVGAKLRTLRQEFGLNQEDWAKLLQVTTNSVARCLAAAQGNKSAIINRDIIAKNLPPHQLIEAQHLATQIQYKN